MVAYPPLVILPVLQATQINHECHNGRVIGGASSPVYSLSNMSSQSVPMRRLTELRLRIEHSKAELLAAIAAGFGVPERAILSWHIHRRAWDARKKSQIMLVYTVDAELAVETPKGEPTPVMSYQFAAKAKRPPAKRPVIIGTGPCGILAALILAEAGFCPLVLERGKLVRERTKDTWALWRRGELDPASNVQFGEGGAGTFSDGKLYSQIKDPRHLGRKVMEEFVEAGAPEEILYIAKPHIGTFRLVTMVEAIRAKVEALGGEYRFGAKVDDFEIDNGQMRAVILESGERIETEHVILAIGHSARDTFARLHERGVFMEAKPFSIGFRIEHPQGMIDRHRFGPFAGHPILGAADYKLVHHAKNGRSVYSFCMCPGGTVVAATSEPGRVVTNGMSQYSRAERNANAGIVVGITPADYPGDVLAGVEFQRQWESAAFVAGGGGYKAPGQLVGDFIAGRASTAFGEVQPSYKPGVHLTDLAFTLPDYAIAAMREALPAFGRQIKGFDRPDAVLTGVETRTSSPVRITRGKDFCSLNVRGLYPAGEGAGYAGGILSAGVDGIKVAEAVSKCLSNT